MFSRGCEQAQELAWEVRREAMSLTEEQIPIHSEVFMIQETDQEIPGSGGLTGGASGDLRGGIESQR